MSIRLKIPAFFIMATLPLCALLLHNTAVPTGLRERSCLGSHAAGPPNHFSQICCSLLPLVQALQNGMSQRPSRLIEQAYQGLFPGLSRAAICLEDSRAATDFRMTMVAGVDAIPKNLFFLVLTLRYQPPYWLPARECLNVYCRPIVTTCNIMRSRLLPLDGCLPALYCPSNK